MNYSGLPGLIALTILVAVFRSIMRRSNDERQQLWLIGWALVLLHVIVHSVAPGFGRWQRIILVLSLDCLVLAGIAFLISFARVASNREYRRRLAAVLGFSAVCYTTLSITNAAPTWLWYVVTVVAVAGTMTVVWSFFHRMTGYVAGLFAGCLAFACGMVILIATGRSKLGDELIVATIYVFAGALYWQHYRRWTAGVLTSVLGFVAWGAISPSLVGSINLAHSPSIPVQFWDLPKYFVAVGMILTLLEDQILATEQLAFYDALTGLPNRRLLRDRLEQALTRARRQKTAVVVLMLDVDNFKLVNDNFGHEVGDRVLKKVAARLAGAMRASDTVSRIGGDEFVVVAEIPDANGARALSSTLRSAFPVRLELEGTQITITTSMGSGLYPDDGDCADELLVVADNAMYAGKRSRTARLA